MLFSLKDVGSLSSGSSPVIQPPVCPGIQLGLSTSTLWDSEARGADVNMSMLMLLTVWGVIKSLFSDPRDFCLISTSIKI